MMKKLIYTIAIGTMALSATSAAFAADATVTIKGGGAGVGLGYSSGTGVLNYKGNEIPFEWSNFSFGKVGATSGEATGEVNGLTFLEKFNGCYGVGALDATLVAGGFTRTLKNKSGVVMNVKGKEKGLDLTVSTGCAKVTMDPDALAKALAKLNAPPVPANYSSSIYFDTNSEAIRDSETAKLDKVITELQKTPGTEVIVTGFTDATGSEQHNQKLSTERAEAVFDALTARAKGTNISQLPPQRVEVSGRGELKGPENQPEQAHRRVDILVVHPKNAGSA